MLEAGKPKLIRTGIILDLPSYVRAWITPRSGLAGKHGITIPNAPGLIDPQYRGEVAVILLWNGHNPNCYAGYEVAAGDRIAQVTFQRIDEVEIFDVEEVSETVRGTGGFGSTGL